MNNTLSTLNYLFAILFLALFFLILYGEILIRKGRAKEGFSIYDFSVKVFSTFIMIALIFYSINLLSFKEEKNIEVENIDWPEIPGSPAVNFPPPPDYMNISGYNFRGPFKVDNTFLIPKETISLFICKEEEVKLLYVDYLDKEITLNKYDKFSCFLENCKGENINYLFLYVKEEENKEEGLNVGVKKKEKDNILEGIREREEIICDLN